MILLHPEHPDSCGSQDNLNDKLSCVLLFDWNVIKEYGGGLERKIIVGDEGDNLVGKLPVFDSVRA